MGKWADQAGGGGGVMSFSHHGGNATVNNC